mmetsp:Transcript_75568/g.122745  ORF Transcript_75568/g.122745 Transcript_75568/m.122745 type:complete len:503 (-) Transcript_75568:224-1732(-)
MPTVVRFVGEIPPAASLKGRGGVVLGTKASLTATNVFQYCKAAISPAGEVSETDFDDAVGSLDSDSAEHLPIVGKWASVACLPVTCSRNNCSARPDTVKALIKGALKKKNSVVVIVAPKEHFLALAAAVIRSAPAVYSLKTSADETQYEILVTLVEISAHKAVGVFGDDLCHSLTLAAQGIRLAQRLVDAPPNIMHTDAMLEECYALAACPVPDGKVSIKVIRGEELRDQGFGGLWNVGMAAPKPPALVILSYDPTDATADAKTICWVGKGIIYDTGGLSIKSKSGMPSMKRDMGGSAAVLGAFSAATQIGSKDKKLRAVLCLAENSVDSIAFRPDDIITMRSGKTCEVNNTDAEGRLVLADGCHYAADVLKADVIIDMATLTGAQVTATGKKHALLLCNDVAWEQLAVASGLTTGDMVFPAIYCPELFMDQAFTSQVADFKNSADDRSNALASCAGHFIEANLPKDYNGPWIHVDMAAQVAEAELATGWGVMLFLRLFNYV